MGVPNEAAFQHDRKLISVSPVSFDQKSRRPAWFFRQGHTKIRIVFFRLGIGSCHSGCHLSSNCRQLFAAESAPSIKNNAADLGVIVFALNADAWCPRRFCLLKISAAIRASRSVASQRRSTLRAAQCFKNFLTHLFQSYTDLSNDVIICSNAM